MAKVAKVKYTVGPDVDLRKTVVLDKDGTRITNARARKIAKETLRSVGRPSLSGAAEHSPEIKGRLPEKMKKAFEKEASRRGASTSALLREVIEEFLKKNKAI